MSAGDNQRSERLSHWLQPEQTQCEVTAWKVSDGAERHPNLADRMTLSLYTGAATIALHPTRAEAFALLMMLEWALEPGPAQFTNRAPAAETAGATS